MIDNLPEADRWLPIKQAAEKLGIHPTTLRRWAKNGEIPFMLTPGRHRRFALTDVERFAENRRRLRVTGGLERIWADQTITRTRSEIVNGSEMRWLAGLNEQARAQGRSLGKRLMGLMLKYIFLPDGGEDILKEARAIGCEYAETAQSIGMPLTNALEATQFFRDTMVETAIQLPETANIRPETNMRLMRRINTLLNTVQLALAEKYEQ